MLLLLIFLLIFYFFKIPSVESFTSSDQIPDLSDQNLKKSLETLNNYFIEDNSISIFIKAIKKFNYFSYNNSSEITVLIPLNSTILQYLSWIMSDENEINKSPNITNNCFILGNIFNDRCIIDNSLNNCGPFDKNELINKSNQNLSNTDFIVSNIQYKDGIIHLVDFLLENSNNINLLKKNYFIEFNRDQRNSHLGLI